MTFPISAPGSSTNLPTSACEVLGAWREEWSDHTHQTHPHSLPPLPCTCCKH